MIPEDWYEVAYVFGDTILYNIRNDTMIRTLTATESQLIDDLIDRQKDDMQILLRSLAGE